MTDSIPLKQCSRKENCVHPDGPWLPATTEYFYKRSNVSSGLQWKCKVCCKAEYEPEKRSLEGKEYYEKNKETIKAKVQERYYKDPQKCLERSAGYYQENKKKLHQDSLQFRKDHPLMAGAHSAVNNAVRRGKLPKASTLSCANCGLTADHYHHWSYEREHWLDVVPLCMKCHHKLHRKYRGS